MHSLGGRVLFYDLAHEAIFDGTGDWQFQVYRDMRTATGNQWQDFHAETNVSVCGSIVP